MTFNNFSLFLANILLDDTTDTTAENSDFWSGLWANIQDFFKVEVPSVLIRVALALLLLVAGYYLIKLISHLVRKWLLRAKKISDKKQKGQMDPSVVTFVVSTIKFLLAIVLALGVIAVLGIALDGAVSIISSAFLAIGIGLQDVITNFADGVILMSEKNIKTGDYILVDDFEGTVTKISMMKTTLVTAEKKTVLIPNSLLCSEVVVNFTTQKYRRLVLYFSFPFGTDINKMGDLLLEVVNSLELTVQEDGFKPSITVDDFSQSRVDVVKIRIAFYSLNENYWTLMSSAQRAIYERFVKEGIRGAEFKNEIYLPK